MLCELWIQRDLNIAKMNNSSVNFSNRSLGTEDSERVVTTKKSCQKRF